MNEQVTARPDARSRPLLHRAWLEGGEIRVAAPWDRVAEEVFSGRIVVLKGAYDRERALRFRRAIVQWGRTNAPYPHGTSPALRPDLNYHRVDDGTVQGVCAHVFHQYGFKSIDQLDEELRPLAHEVAQTMKDVQNKIAGTTFDVSPTDLYLKALQYPSGAGFLAEHVHPVEPQGVGLITSLSRLGEDISIGGTTFATPFGFVDVTNDHDIGDIIVFRYNLPHAVTLVDPGRKLDWDSDGGKWSVVLELRQTHGLSHKGSPG